MQKEIVGLHSPLHTIHYISITTFRTSQPDYGQRTKERYQNNLKPQVRIES